MRGERPLVSVITIFLDEERFLAEAIESVRAQTYEAWELLLVDDGSSDDSAAIARRYAAAHPGRIRYLEHPDHANRGKSASRNLGLRAARGEYVTFLDGDDVFLPDKLARQVGLLAERPESAMVYGLTEYWYSWTGRQSARGRDAIPTLGVERGMVLRPPASVTHFLEHPGFVPCICAVLARHATALDVGGFDESIQHLYEDQVFLSKMFLAGPVLADDGCGERYRQHADSSSNVARRAGEYHPFQPNRAHLVYLEWLRDYAARLHVADPAFRRALNRALRPYRHPALHAVMRVAGSARYAFNWVRNYVTGVARLAAERLAADRPRSPS